MLHRSQVKAHSSTLTVCRSRVVATHSGWPDYMILLARIMHSRFHLVLPYVLVYTVGCLRQMNRSEKLLEGHVYVSQ